MSTSLSYTPGVNVDHCFILGLELRLHCVNFTLQCNNALTLISAAALPDRLALMVQYVQAKIFKRKCTSNWKMLILNVLLLCILVDGCRA